MKINPILKKDLKVSSRSMKLSWSVFAYEGALTLAFLWALMIIQEENSIRYGSGNIYNSLIYLFPVIAVVQVCIIAFITPIITASSISGEKERQTFEVMMTTCMSPFSVVWGKVLSAVVQIMFYVLASFPIMALAFIAGGISWGTLLLFLLAVMLLAFFSGSIGILCSTMCRKSITAVIVSYIFYFIIYVGTFFPMIGKVFSASGNGGESMLALLLNPGVFFEEFFMRVMTGDSLFYGSTFDEDDVGIITYFLIEHGLWIYVSAIGIALLTLLFLLWAARNVNPLNAKVTKRKKGKKNKRD